MNRPPSPQSPLKGRTILITRRSAQSKVFRELLEKAGARVVEAPTIEIEARPLLEVLPVLSRLAEYDWLILTSPNGAEIFLLYLAEAGFSVPAAVRICAIGPATARVLEEHGQKVALLPKIYQAEGILEDFMSLHQGHVKGLKVLLARASRARDLLPLKLQEFGVEMTVLALYDTVIPPESGPVLAKVLEKEAPDLVAFTSSSTVENFLTLLEGQPPGAFRFAAIGPVTGDTARRLGLNVVVQPEQATIPDFVRSIEQYFSKHVESQ
ncbi:MAG: uroporphyrinogen-III synthase [Acidobacteria bacterium]|nr:uroporphyrinogen-III synthase [Acidobacteriota bacterium]